MTCPTCGGAFVQRGPESSTLMGYRSNCPKGSHDDNCLKRAYVCANDHVTVLSVIRSCRCGWKGKTSCFCCGEKIAAWPDEVPSPATRAEFNAFMEKYER